MRVGATLLLVEILSASPALAATFSDARAAYDDNRVGEAERLYAEVIADKNTSAADRASAERELARIAWMIDGNSKSALAHLAAAKAVGDQLCETAEMVARVWREAKLHSQAVEGGDALIASCPEAGERDAIRTHLIGARLDIAATTPAERAAQLAAARAEAAKFTADADVEAARVRLETALLLHDAPSALGAWKDYFWLEETDAPQALGKAGVTGLFTAGLASNASPQDQLRLTELLMRAGFAEQSKRFADDAALGGKVGSDPTWKRLQAYWFERSKLEGILLGINRGLARGKPDGGRTLALAKAFAAALMQAAGATGDPRDALKKYYSFVGTAGETNGYPSIHGGHVIEDHADRVTQYGKSADIHFIAVDNLASNGFTSWLWDGSAMVGGWTADGTIVHIRPGYVQSPLRGYRQSQDSVQRRLLIERERPLAAEDLAKLKQRPVATLLGLAARLQLQLVDRIAAVAHTKSHDEAGFRRAFLAEYSRANLDQSIRVHEGRHAIDEALGISAKVEQPVLEYQAKLSELALTDYPRMALTNMNRGLEGDGPHDRAGARVFDQFRQWIEAHKDQVIGYDPALPALVQLDKLSDSQIREIARSLDPLPNGKPSPAKL